MLFLALTSMMAGSDIVFSWKCFFRRYYLLIPGFCSLSSSVDYANLSLKDFSMYFSNGDIHVGVKIPLCHRGELTLTFWVNSLPHLICLLIGVVKFLLQSNAHMHLGHKTNPMGWVSAMSKICLIWTLNRIRIDPLSNREQCFWLFGDWQYTCLAKFRPCVSVYIHLWQSLHNPVCPISVFTLIFKEKVIDAQECPLTCPRSTVIR